MTAERILVTGAAGFIGAKVTEYLLDDGYGVVGVDSINDAYDPRLKEWRLARLQGKSGFDFHRLDICDRLGLRPLFARNGSAPHRGHHQPRRAIRMPWRRHDPECATDSRSKPG